MITPTDTTPKPIDGAELLADVGATIARYVVLPSTSAAIAVVLWIAAAHAVPAWNCALRLVIRAPERRCGKSRLLDMVEGMSHRPLMTVNASPSAVYRSIGIAPSDPPTLLIDEADTIFGPKAGENEDLRGLLNAGHQRGRPALRYDAGSRSVEKIATFAMVALAGIGAMPDTTLGTKPLRELTAPMLRGWRQSVLDGGLGPVTAAKAYRLLRSILSTAVEDDSSKPTRATSRELLWSAVRSDRC